MERSESIGNLAASLAKARAAFKSISKDRSAKIVSTKGSFSYSYADLATVVEATSSALAANEIAVLQPTSLSGGHVVVTTVLAHSSGEWVSESMEWPIVATDNRSIGSGITYARRHSLLAMVAAAATDDDDDAEAARGGSRPTAQAQRNHGSWPPGVPAVAAGTKIGAKTVGDGEVETPLIDLVRHARSLDELGKLTPALKKAPAEDMDALRDAWREAQNRLAGVKTNGGAA
jgi:hypothetical protein